MASTLNRWVARLLWAAPALLFFLSVDQALVAVDLRETLHAGTPAVAEVVHYERTDRAEVMYGYVDLRVPLADGTVLTQEKMSLPHALMHEVEGKTTLPVRVLPGADQPIVIASIAATQWKMAALQSAMSFGAFLVFFAGVFWWNRHLRRQGDPGMAPAATPALA